MVESVSRDTLGGETRDFSPEMVGGSWEGGFQEERSKCTAVRFMCLCDVRRLCVITKKVAIMIIDIQSINTPHFNTFVFRMLCLHQRGRQEWSAGERVCRPHSFCIAFFTVFECIF